MAKFDPAPYSASGPLLRSVKNLPKPMSHAHHSMTVRSFKHKGHSVAIATMYTIRIDGKKFNLPISVDATGHVSCHSLPNYSAASAVDMVKAVIDQFPKEFSKKKTKSARTGAGGHGGHQTQHHH